MKVVRFTRNRTPYNGGELAGFPDEHADELIAEGIAIEVADPDARDEVTPTVIEEIPADSRRRRGGK